MPLTTRYCVQEDQLRFDVDLNSRIVCCVVWWLHVWIHADQNRAVISPKLYALYFWKHCISISHPFPHSLTHSLTLLSGWNSSSAIPFNPLGQWVLILIKAVLKSEASICINTGFPRKDALMLKCLKLILFYFILPFMLEVVCHLDYSENWCYAKSLIILSELLVVHCLWWHS